VGPDVIDPTGRRRKGGEPAGRKKFSGKDRGIEALGREEKPH